MRRRDPRRLLEARRRRRARVRILPVAQPGYDAAGGVGSKQVAEVELPRAELERLWSPESLERLARTYWRFLSRVSLGILRVLYTESSREVVVLARPFVLLSFRPPEYELEPLMGSVTWRIERGLLVAPSGRGRGYLRLTVRRPPAGDGGPFATVTVTSEVVSFYPMLAGLGARAPIGWLSRIGRAVYNQTQLRLHVVVTYAFLRSLARLELEPSAVGALSPASPPLSREASPGRAER